MVKLWLSPRHLPNPPNHYRTISGHTLRTRRLHSFLISSPHHPRRELWLNYSPPSRQRCLNVFHLPISTHRPRPILRLIPLPRDLKHWYHPPIRNHSNSLHRLCPSMRPNILLRRHSNHKPTIRRPIHRNRPSPMSLRRLFSGQRHTHTFLHLSLYPTLHHHNPSDPTPTILTRNRIKQPLRHLLSTRQNHLSPLLHNQGHPRTISSPPHPNKPSTIRTRPPRRPRQLYPSQPPKHPSPH